MNLLVNYTTMAPSPLQTSGIADESDYSCDRA